MTSKEYEIVNDYLYANDFNFIDKLMVQVREAKENYILQEMSKVSFKIGIYVDEKRLKEWLKMCISLQNIPSDLVNNIAIESKIIRLENEIKSLTLENESLKKHLEVLEILKNKNVDVDVIKNIMKDDRKFECYPYDNLTEDEFNKIKEWLENE